MRKKSTPFSCECQTSLTAIDLTFDLTVLAGTIYEGTSNIQLNTIAKYIDSEMAWSSLDLSPSDLNARNFLEPQLFDSSCDKFWEKSLFEQSEILKEMAAWVGKQRAAVGNWVLNFQKRLDAS